MNLRNRGEVVTAVILVIALVGGAAWLFRPKSTHGDSRRAEASADASAKVEATSAKAAATAAASVVKIGEANTEAPESPSKAFITREVPVALASLPAPDANALIAAERRKVAIMEGRLDEARALYSEALKKADTLQREKQAALAARRAVDDELARVAAERLGAERQRNMTIAVAVLCVVLFGYVKLTHLSPGRVADVVADIRGGASDAIGAIDTATTPFQQKIVRLLTKLK